jgi:hypothetical protein
MAFTVPIFMKIVSAERHHLEIFYLIFTQTGQNMEITARNAFML